MDTPVTAHSDLSLKVENANRKTAKRYLVEKATNEARTIGTTKNFPEETKELSQKAPMEEKSTGVEANINHHKSVTTGIPTLLGMNSSDENVKPIKPTSIPESTVATKKYSVDDSKELVQGASKQQGHDISVETAELYDKSPTNKVKTKVKLTQSISNEKAEKVPTITGYTPDAQTSNDYETSPAETSTVKSETVKSKITEVARLVGNEVGVLEEQETPEHFKDKFEAQTKTPKLLEERQKKRNIANKQEIVMNYVPVEEQSEHFDESKPNFKNASYQSTEQRTGEIIENTPTQLGEEVLEGEVGYTMPNVPKPDTATSKKVRSESTERVSFISKDVGFKPLKADFEDMSINRNSKYENAFQNKSKPERREKPTFHAKNIGYEPLEEGTDGMAEKETKFNQAVPKESATESIEFASLQSKQIGFEPKEDSNGNIINMSEPQDMMPSFSTSKNTKHKPLKNVVSSGELTNIESSDDVAFEEPSIKHLRITKSRSESSERARLIPKVIGSEDGEQSREFSGKFEAKKSIAKSKLETPREKGKTVNVPKEIGHYQPESDVKTLKELQNISLNITPLIQENVIDQIPSQQSLTHGDYQNIEHFENLSESEAPTQEARVVIENTNKEFARRKEKHFGTHSNNEQITEFPSQSYSEELGVPAFEKQQEIYTRESNIIGFDTEEMSAEELPINHGHPERVVKESHFRSKSNERSTYNPYVVGFQEDDLSITAIPDKSDVIVNASEKREKQITCHAENVGHIGGFYQEEDNLNTLENQQLECKTGSQQIVRTESRERASSLGRTLGFNPGLEEIKTENITLQENQNAQLNYSPQDRGRVSCNHLNLVVSPLAISVLNG